MKALIKPIISGAILLGIASLSLSGCKDPQDLGHPPSLATKLDAEASDKNVTKNVKTALLEDESLRAFNIVVTTTKGDVALTGVVNTQSQVDQAVKIAQGIKDVKVVHHHLSLSK